MTSTHRLRCSAIELIIRRHHFRTLTRSARKVERVFYLTTDKSYTTTLCAAVGYTTYNVMPRHLRKFRELNAQIRQRNLKQEAGSRPSSSDTHAQQPSISNEQLGENNQDASSGGFDDRSGE